MSHRLPPTFAAAAAALVLALAACATTSMALQDSSTEATLEDPDGENVGSVTLTPTPHGAHVEATFQGLPPGTHAFHIHETGSCSPDFEAAGGHLNGGEAHGILDEDGMHAGDLPNIHVPESGQHRVELFHDGVTIDPEASSGEGPVVHDDDGSAVVVHEGEDDYTSDPAGDAGERIACGVLR